MYHITKISMSIHCVHDRHDCVRIVSQIVVVSWKYLTVALSNHLLHYLLCVTLSTLVCLYESDDGHSYVVRVKIFLCHNKPS